MLYIAKWKATLIVLVGVLGLLYAAPNFLERGALSDLPAWLPGQQVNLGLDLQGGSHLLMEADVDQAIGERFEALESDVRAALRKARIRYRGLNSGPSGVSVTISDAARLDEARRLLRDIDGDYVLSAGESGRLTLGLDEQTRKELTDAVMSQSIEVVRRRVDELGTTEPTIQRQGAQRIIVQVPGFDDPERLKEVIGQTAKLSFLLVDDSVTPAEARAGRMPAGSMILPSAEARDFGVDEYLVRRRAVVSGENLVDAFPTVQDGQPVVSFRFDAVGGKRFGDATARNVGRLLAIALDGKVISAPRIQGAIPGGTGIITGNFTFQSASDLALLLRAGALPAPMQILEERTVGPGLGQDSIDAGKIAAILGLILVAGYMIAAYGLFGIFADLALVLNLALLLALLSVLQATLTLPGIAGIVLTVGMAVDANVLIFERIREELRQGRSTINAVEAGYKRAITTIVDANITTLIAAVVLFQFGSGPIKGFAVTLALGILTSMFSAIMITRLLVVTWMRRRRPQRLPI